MLLTPKCGKSYLPRTMRSLTRCTNHWRAIVIGLTLGLVLPCSVLLSDDLLFSDTAPSSQVVLLKNNRCLTGSVRRVGDQVLIELSDNAKVTKPATEVEFVGSSLEEVYRYKVGKFTRLGLGEHFQLTRWCLSVGLNEYAAEHYLEVSKQAGEHPSVKQLGIELRERLLQDEKFRTYLGLPATVAKDVAKETKVQPVSTHQATALVVHPLVISQFSERVQPILLNRCSQSGCHGMNATNQLKLLSPVGSAYARVSEQNCRSALAFLDVDESQLSVLVRKALTAHGTQKAPGVTAQELKLVEQLQMWAQFARSPVVSAGGSYNVSAQGSSTVPAVYASPSDPKSRTSESGLEPVASGAAQLRQVPRQGASASDFAIPSGERPPLASELDALDAEVRRVLGEPPYDSNRAVAPQQSGGSKNPAAPVSGPGRSSVPNSLAPKATAEKTKSDPFDPAEFNRQVRQGSRP